MLTSSHTLVSKLALQIMLQVFCFIRNISLLFLQNCVDLLHTVLWLNICYIVNSLLHWTPLGPSSSQDTWDGRGIWGKCWGTYDCLILSFSYLDIVICKLNSSILFNRLLERIILWSLLTPGGHSVLSLMLVSSRPQLETVSSVPWRY
jgi:hypothetical protein